ncbi:MAG: transposase [Terriglobia bacterium]
MSSFVTSRAAWQKRVVTLVPSLSPSQAKVLGLISSGIVLFDGCGMTRLSNGLAKVEQVPAGRLRQRLRECYDEAEAKRGKKRREVDVRACFGALLAGILRDWHGEKQLSLALDASTLGERFTVLNLSVLYRGCALPVAWVIIRAKQKGSWRPYWEGLLVAVASVVPPDWKVIVTADQGLYADWLWTAIRDLGWHPLLRVRLQMGFRADREADFAAIGKRVQRRGRGWKGKGEWSEEGARLQGTLLVRWEKGDEEARAVVTDLPEEDVEIAWYLMRFWMEDEYTDHKRGGWGWQHTKMQDPRRAERRWLAMAVACP